MTLKIVYKKIEDLIPYTNNSRTHDESQIEQIAKSIQEFGWTNPILLDGANGIIAGHGRVLAAQKLGEAKIPTIELSHLTENQKRSYIIADNKLALNAGWDAQMLSIEIDNLKQAGYGIDILGFDDKELNTLFGKMDDVHDGDSPVNENRNLLMIECKGEWELEILFKEMQNRGYECKILS